MLSAVNLSYTNPIRKRAVAPVFRGDQPDKLPPLDTLDGREKFFRLANEARKNGDVIRAERLFTAIVNRAGSHILDFTDNRSEWILSMAGCDLMEINCLNGAKLHEITGNLCSYFDVIGILNPEIADDAASDAEATRDMYKICTGKEFRQKD